VFRNYLKTSLRALLKNKTYSFLNIFGLAIGIACAGLIFLWVEDELHYDQFNVKKDRLYFARVNSFLNAGVFTHSSTPGVMAPAIQAEIPGVANTCRTSEDDTRLLFSIDNKPVFASGKYVEPSLFNMFTLPFVQGNPKTAFAQLYSLVITEKTSKKFFGNEKNVIGKTVRVDNKQDYVITGVLKDIPENSSLRFEWVAPFQIWYQQSPWAYEWGNNCLSTYVELKPGASLDAINKQLYNFVQKRAPTSTGHIFLFGMNNWHLYGDFENGKPTGSGQIVYVRLFSMIAWIILFIACINFMNLATARSEKRAREVGVRKVMGAGRRKLIAQFIGEAVFMAFLSAVVAVIIMAALLGSFNMLVQKNLLLELNNPVHWVALLLITCICGVVAGSYPSLYLSSFNPVFVLKGIKVKSGSAAWIRKGLVVTQFTVSIVLIIATIIIFQQIQYIKDRNLGFNRDGLLELSMQGDMNKHYDGIKQDLMQTGLVEYAGLADHTTIYGGNNTDGLAWQGKAPGSKILISWRSVDTDFFSAMDMKVLAGRNFYVTDTLNYDSKSLHANAIITESLAKLLGRGSAIGKTIYDENDTLLRATVVGVVNDYVYGDMYGKPDPVMFVCTSPRFENIIYLRAKPGVNAEHLLTGVGAVMKKDNPAYPFEYRFVDDQFNDMFQTEMLMSRLSRVFAALTILISCLGLFGLAAYTAERRIREIGIRKVLGATVAGLAGLLSVEFLKLILLSLLLAFPLAWLAMHKWLQNYAYRVDIHWWVFIMAGVAAILIAIITVSFQAIRAAVSNPVKSLRAE
jgi:putative ABC transport system permease protein